MITRQQAQDQANDCFLYHAGAFIATAAGLALTRNRSATQISTIWAMALATHAVLLYALPRSRERILMWTAAGMEDRQRLQQEVIPADR